MGLSDVVSVQVGEDILVRPSRSPLPSPVGSPVDPADLTLSPARMREWTRLALERVLAHEAGLADVPVVGDVSGQGLRGLLPEDPSRTGEDPAALLGLLFDELVPRSFNTASPGHFGWIPAGGVFTAAVADFVAGGVNRYTGMFGAAPALVQLEADALNWLCRWVGYPTSARGSFTTGGSIATLEGVVCARETLLGTDLRDAVVYTSADAHLSVAKAVRLAGFGPQSLRRVPVDVRRRMRPEVLATMIHEDRRAGRRPFLVVATAGTTGAGAVDPLADVADVAEREGLWLHVDAAYGGFFRLCPELRPALDALSRADSLTVDPHKSLFLPYGTGALLVRDGELLRRANAETDSYLPAPPEPTSHYDPSQYGPALTRGFPGLRVWLTVQAYGTDRLIAALQEKRQLARWAAQRLAAVPQVRLLAEPDLSLFAFHVHVPGGSLAQENAATRRLVDTVCAGGRTLLTGCRLDGREYARVCVLSFRTRAAHVSGLVRDVARAAQEVAVGPASDVAVETAG